MREELPRPSASETDPEILKREINTRFPGVDPEGLAAEDLEMWRLVSRGGTSKRQFDAWRTAAIAASGGRRNSPRGKLVSLLSNALRADMFQAEDMLTMPKKP